MVVFILEFLHYLMKKNTSRDNSAIFPIPTLKQVMESKFGRWRGKNQLKNWTSVLQQMYNQIKCHVNRFDSPPE